jgi:hypothetical protein
MKKSIAHPDSYEAPLTGFKIVVNPGNGGGAFIADQVCAQDGRGLFGPRHSGLCWAWPDLRASTCAWRALQPSTDL